MDRSFLYGDGLFETVRVEDGRVFFRQRHLRRFQSSARSLGYREPQIERGIAAIEAIEPDEDGLVRVTVSRDDESAPFSGEGSITTTSRPLPHAKRPALTTLNGWYWPEDPLGSHKTTSYLRWVEARRRATAKGFDDALMTSADGLVGETSVCNVFVSIGGRLVTPPTAGLLPGVCRAAVIDMADELDVEVVVRPIRRDELDEATEIVCTSAGVLAVSALSLDERPLDEAFGPRLQRLLRERGA